jgi:cell wall-associated NlpC family hydrolase
MTALHRTRIASIAAILAWPALLLWACAASPRQTARPVPRPAAVKQTGWAVQAGAFGDVRNADRLSSRIAREGHETFFFRTERGYLAVRFGEFDRRDEAERAAARLVAAGIIDTWFLVAPGGRATGIFRPGEAPPSVGGQVPPGRANPPGAPSPRPEGSNEDLGEVAARTAERFIGIPYLWGGDTVIEGLDCSGFARAVYQLMGYSIPRTSREQFKVGAAVDRAGLREGDLVFFGKDQTISHVGIYVGGGRFVHAPKRGEEIRVDRLEGGRYEERYRGARRYI